MGRAARPVVATFFAADEPLVAGAVLMLGEGVAHHVRARREGPGSEICLVDGLGHRARAMIVRVARRAVQAEVMEVREIPPPPAVHLLVPVADRDRMLWLAEKSTEMGASSWRPVLWRRSLSVSPRGEGPTFAHRVKARMTAALEQSGRAHLPHLFAEARPDLALAALPTGTRIALLPAGTPILRIAPILPTTIAIGPEGGFEASEEDALAAAGFVPASLGDSILRFETAGLAALAVVRAALHSTGSATP